MATDSIRSVFDPDWVKSESHRDNLVDWAKHRLNVVTANGPRPENLQLREMLWRWRQEKAAWEAYLDAGFCVGLFNEPYARDMLERLRGDDPHNFRSALSECMAAWYLAGYLKFEVSSKPPGKGLSQLDLAITHPIGEIKVEVKSPLREWAGKVMYGDESGALGDVMEQSCQQFARTDRNLLIICPQFRIRVWEQRRQLVKAFIGQQVIQIPINILTGESGPPGTTFKFDGLFARRHSEEQKPRFTRISAVLVIENVLGYSSILHHAFLLHNPEALLKLPTEGWDNTPQLICESGRLRWNDGADIWNS